MPVQKFPVRNKADRIKSRSINKKYGKFKEYMEVYCQVEIIKNFLGGSLLSSTEMETNFYSGCDEKKNGGQS